MRIAGIMSGTSLDGIDVAIVDFAGKGVATIAGGTVPYSDEVRERILAVSNSMCHTRDLSRLNFELGELYASAVIETCRKAGVPVDSLELAGCHGQTIYHEGSGPAPNTLQIGEAAILAEYLDIPVVSDFRTRDVAAGGQGAPLVPYADYLLFRSPKVHRVALNIGGIANLTVLPAGASEAAITAFDTGPGNMVIDQLVERMSEGRQRYDEDGSIAASGHLVPELLEALLADPWFDAPPPKSAGREQYGAAFVARLLETGKPLEDLIATATALTAGSIAHAVRQFAPGTQEVIAAGGGVHNRQLMAQLAAFLPSCEVGTTAAFGIDPDAKEAIAFAVLAYRTWKRLPGNLPSATGAGKPVVLGKVTFRSRM